MVADGTWNIVVASPIGERRSVVSLKTEGGALTGDQSADGDSSAIFDGTIDGNDIAWKVSITQPMDMILEFAGRIDNDAISGNVKLGDFGAASFSGTRD